MAILEKNLNKSVEDINFLCEKTACGNSRRSVKRRAFLVVIMQVFNFKGLIFREALIYLEFSE